MLATPENQLAILLAVGTFGMLFLAGAIVLFVFFYQKKMLQERLKLQDIEAAYQQKMLGAALESQENERIRVSKDLHDDVGMMLMTMRAYLNSVTEKTLAEKVIPDIRTLVDDTHETVRRLSWDLMPSTLERFGLAQTIREMCDRLSLRGSTPVTFSEEHPAPSLDKNQETLLYRIIQEGVTNALRHSKATKVEIVFARNNPFLDVLIKDDGIGFDFPLEKNGVKPQHGLGLLNIESRASILNAQLAFKPNAPKGTILQIKLKVDYDG